MMFRTQTRVGTVMSPKTSSALLNRLLIPSTAPLIVFEAGGLPFGQDMKSWTSEWSQLSLTHREII